MKARVGVPARPMSLSFGSAESAPGAGASYPPSHRLALPAAAAACCSTWERAPAADHPAVERGLDAWSPSARSEMLDVLRAALPQTVALLGTTQRRIQLDDNSVDAVIPVAQAWHW